MVLWVILLVAVALNLMFAGFWLYSALKLRERRLALDQLLVDMRRREVYLLDAIQEVESFTLQGWIPANYLSKKGQKETRH